MGCLSDQQVRAYGAGAEHRDHRDHVATCADCRGRVQLALGSQGTVDGALPAGTATPVAPGHEQTLAAGAVAVAGTAETLADTSPGARGSGDRIALGTTLGRYVIRGVLGRGGMGVVYSAFDPELDRKVALKLLRPDVAADREGAAARLLREGRAIARLAHPNVVTVFDVGTHGDAVFIAMELVEGHSLDVWIAERRRDWREVARVFLQAGEGLVAAHAAGLVHRDFKPANVLLGTDGRARVTDFGVARIGQGDEGPSQPRLGQADVQLTQTGAMIGTPAYMPPEQLDGQPADARADQFSFAASLYEALYGERPFAGGSLGELYAEVTAERVRPAPAGSTVPAWLRAVVLRGLRADPAARHPRLSELLDALRRDPAVRRRRLVAGGGVATVVGAAVALAVLRPGAGPGVDCAGEADRKLDAAWRTPRKALPSGDLVTRVDQRGGEWRTASIGLCQRPDPDPVLRGNEQSCLASQLELFEVLAAQLVHEPTAAMRTRIEAEFVSDTPARCADHVRRVYPLPLPADPTKRQQALAARVAYLRVQSGSPSTTAEVTVALARQALTLAEQSGHFPTIATAWSVLGVALLSTDDAEGAASAWRKSITAAERGNAPAELANSQVLLANVLCSLPGRTSDCGAELERASAYFAEHPDEASEQFQLTYAGYEGTRLAPEAGVARLRAWIATHPDAATSPYVAEALTPLEELSGRPRKALQAVQASLPRARATNLPALVADSLQVHCRDHLELGQVAEARRSLSELEGLAAKDAALQPYALGCAASIAVATGDLEGALATVELLAGRNDSASLHASLLGLHGRLQDARATLGPAQPTGEGVDPSAFSDAIDHFDLAFAGRELPAARAILDALVGKLAGIATTSFVWFDPTLRQALLALAQGQVEAATAALTRARALLDARGDDGSLNQRLMVEILAAEACLRGGGAGCGDDLRAPLAALRAGGVASLDTHVANLLVNPAEACREWRWLAPYRTAALVRALDDKRIAKGCR